MNESYLAWSILIVFFVFGIIPAIVSSLSGESNYVTCLLSGVIFGCFVILALAAILAVMWAGIFVTT